MPHLALRWLRGLAPFPERLSGRRKTRHPTALEQVVLHGHLRMLAREKDKEDREEKLEAARKEEMAMFKAKCNQKEAEVRQVLRDKEGLLRDIEGLLVKETFIASELNFFKAKYALLRDPLNEQCKIAVDEAQKTLESTPERNNAGVDHDAMGKGTNLIVDIAATEM